MHSAAPMSGKTGTNGTRNPRSRSGCVRRRTMIPMFTMRNAKSVPMFTSLAISLSGTTAGEGGDEQAEQQGDARRRLARGSGFASDRGSSPSRHIAKVIRVCP